jgi:hypothetical protein
VQTFIRNNQTHPARRHILEEIWPTLFSSLLWFLIVLICVFLLLTIASHAQTLKLPLDITQEPHHKLVLENNQVRVFAVTLAPYEEIFVRYQHNSLTVALQDSEIAIWTDDQPISLTFHVPQGSARFFPGGLARGTRNDSANIYHNVTIEFFDPRITTYGYRLETGQWDYTTSILPPPENPLAAFVNVLPMGIAEALDVQLLANDELPAPPVNAKELLIGITGTDLRIGNGKTIHRDAGEVWWLEDRKSPLINDDTEPTRFIAVEMR